MADTHEFDDPVLNREQSTPLWYIRRAFAVVFYERDENVQVPDFLLVAGIVLGIAMSMFAVAFVATSLVEGVGTAAVAVSLSEMFDPVRVLETTATGLVFSPLVAIFAAAWKLFHGGEFL